MRRARFVANCGLSVACCSALILLGCGGGGGWPDPTTSVAATNNPLVAQYSIGGRPGSTAWVEFGEDINYGRQTSVTPPTVGLGKVLTVLVAGMKPSTTYHMRAHVDWPSGSWIEPDRAFTTGPLPKVSANTTTALTAPTITVSRPTPGLSPAGGVELFNLVEPGNSNMLRAFVTDLQGNIIWYYDPGPRNGDPVPMKPLQNGDFVLNVGDLLEIDLAGNIVRDINYKAINTSLQNNGYSFTITQFHHDLLPLPNGHWIALCNTTKDFTNLPGYPGVTHVLGDALVDIDPSGNVVWAWSGFDHLDVNRHPMGLADFEGAGADWTHSNAILSSADGNLFLSMRNQSWILKIDYENGQGTGDILWRLGYEGDFALSQDNVSDWFYAEHYPDALSDDGTQTTFAIWDNGDGRIGPDGIACGNSPCYSRATIFQIDQSTKVASLIWQDLPGFYSFWGGSIGTVDNGDVEFDQTTPFGAADQSIIEEVTRTDNPQVVWQLNLTGENAYRGYRIPSLYPGVTWK